MNQDMSLSHRIAAGGLIFREDAVLLVRYPDKDSGSYLAAPGGGLWTDENIVQAVERETLEETGLKVAPVAVVMIEDLISTQFKMIKIWMSCAIVGGSIRRTQGAIDEGIIEVDWFKRDQLQNEVVYPRILLKRDWARLQQLKRRVDIPPSRVARF